MRSSVNVVVALCVLCGYGAVFAQPQPAAKPKAAVYIVGNPEGRDALRMAVNTFLVKSGKYQMVAVDAIDVVAREQKRQMSGSVSDGDIAALGRDAGAQYVCVVERSDLDGYTYVATRMVSVQTKVAESADMVELPHGGKIIDVIQWQIGSMLGMAVGPRPASKPKSKEEIEAESRRLEQTKRGEPGGTDGGTAYGAGAARGAATSTIQGIAVPGGSLADKLAWLQRTADSHNTYIVEVNNNEAIAPHTFEFRGAINITIVIRGVGANRAIRLQSHGRMFTIRPNVTFILENNITLQGHNGNNGSMVYVAGGTFIMNGGVISGNTSDYGGGVDINSGAFTMNGGIISGNIATVGCGGVCSNGGTTFTMNGGAISGNTAARVGGGVSVGGTFIMRDGVITGNTAREFGGGVNVHGTFTKTGGTITGYNSDPTNGNVVRDEDGNLLARKGHAVYRGETKRKETTAGPGASFKDDTGAWDQ